MPFTHEERERRAKIRENARHWWKNPGNEFLPPKLPNSLWSEFDGDVKAYFVYVVTCATGTPLRNLPALSDKELWAAYKLVTRRFKVEVPPPVASRLSLGNTFSLFAGLAGDSPYFPEGGCLSEILEDAGLPLEFLERYAPQNASGYTLSLQIGHLFL